MGGAEGGARWGGKRGVVNRAAGWHLGSHVDGAILTEPAMFCSTPNVTGYGVGCGIHTKGMSPMLDLCGAEGLGQLWEPRPKGNYDPGRAGGGPSSGQESPCVLRRH